MDVRALAGVLMEQFGARVASDGSGVAAFDFDEEEMNRRLAELPDDPDEKLR
jgi:hypothetical protein